MEINISNLKLSKSPAIANHPKHAKKRKDLIPALSEKILLPLTKETNPRIKPTPGPLKTKSLTHDLEQKKKV
jgi:hypothetical protein